MINRNFLNDYLAKTFTYTSGPLRASPFDLVDTPLLGSRAFHFFATPEEIIAQVPELFKLREAHGISDRPLLVWEPFPAACKTQNYQAFIDALPLVDVFSPNHLELTSIFTDKPLSSFDTVQVELYGRTLLETHAGRIAGYHHKAEEISKH